MTRLSRLIRHRWIVIGTVAVIALSSLGSAVYHAASPKARPRPAAAPVVPVTVHRVHPRDVRLWSEFSGRMRAIDYAEIRPEVSGRITEVRFEDGQHVKAGDVLFVIDPRPYRAAVAKAEANLASAKTNAHYAETEFDRARRLIKTQAIARHLYDQNANAERVARDAVQAADAELRQARIDLDHAYVKAPIAGRVSRAEITLGNIVQSGPNAPVLTSIVSDDGIYADFDVDEDTYMRIHARATTRREQRRIPVALTLPGDGTRVYKSTLYSFDNRIDPASGTIRARARFANADGSLVPGMFVSVRLASGEASHALLVPLRAVGVDQSRRFVYVVGSDDKVVYRAVRLGRRVGGQRIVLAGLSAGERVIVDGLQHVRPGVMVKAVDAAREAAPRQRLAGQ